MADLSVSATARENNRQLEDLKQEHERKLNKLRTEQAQREEDLRTQGDAAVNHIRRGNEERIESTRAEADARLKREDDTIRKNYNALKTRSVQQHDILERDMALEVERSRESQRALRDRETETLRRSQEKLSEFLADQSKLRAEAAKRTNSEIQSTEARGNEQLMKAKRASNDELRKTEAAHKASIEELKGRNHETFDQARLQAERRLDELRKDNQSQITRETSTSQVSLNELRKKYREAANREQRDGEHRLSRLAEDNAKALEQNRARALATNEKTQAQYSAETQRVITDGERAVRDEQLRFEERRRHQDASNQEALSGLEGELLAKEYRTRKEHESRLGELDRSVDETIRQQRDDFKERFALNEKTFKESLGNQKETYLRELYKQKKMIDSRMGLEGSRANDPFYRLKSFDAKIIEHPTAYELTARVPAHERDTVDVRVKDDKITISARRSYEDAFQDSAVRTTTNSHQTYRQEFQLAVPADAAKALTSVKEDGSIRVLVPKKGYVEKKTQS